LLQEGRDRGVARTSGQAGMLRFQLGSRAIVYGAGVFLVAASVATAEPAAQKPSPGAERTAQALDRIRSEPLELRNFLKRMPKGADLHNHLDGAVYAETFIRVGAEDQLCIDTVAKAFSKLIQSQRPFRSLSRSSPELSPSRYARRATFQPRTPSRTRPFMTSWSIPSPCAALSRLRP
jgi:hypothetical protein